MSNLEHLTKEEYNSEPVYYCPTCLSLRIKILNDNVDYCDECGGTDIAVTSIEEWEKLYKERFNRTYVDYGSSRKQQKRETFL